MFTRWLIAFALTQSVEVPIYRRALGGRTAVAFGASAMTHPFVWAVLVPAWEWAYLRWMAPFEARRIVSPWGRFALMALIVETLVVCAEALYLRAFGLRRAFAWSLVANGASFSVGLVLAAIGSALERYL